MLEVVMELPDGFAASLKPDERVEVEQASGARIDDAQNALVFERKPYPGRFVKTGNLHALTDDEGYFRISDLPVGAAKAEVQRDLFAPFLEGEVALDPAGLDVPNDAAAPALVLIQRLQAPGPMNPPDPDAHPGHVHGAVGPPPPRAVLTCDLGPCPMKCDAAEDRFRTDKAGC
jgi:hypothetical protein